MTTPAPGPFSRRAVRWIVGICAASVLAGIALAMWGDPLAGHRSHRADSTSPSAIGHEAFRRLLESLDIPVVVSRTPATRLAAREGLLIVAEPFGGDDLRERCARARASLLVLPKWDGPAASDREDWLGAARPADPRRVAGVLEAFDDSAAVTTAPHGGTRWTGSAVAPAITPLQLVGGGALEPVVACAEGTLVGAASLAEAPNATCWVLADPDCLATHGLGRGDNAALAVWIVDRLRGGGPVVFDETVHGIQVDPSLLRELGRLPLALVVMQGLLGVALLGWLAMVRFGAPEPLPPPHAAGPRFLIASTAALQRTSGHAGHALLRHWRGAARRVADRLHLAPDLAPDALAAALAARTAARGVDADVAMLRDAAEAAGSARGALRPDWMLDIARRIQRWQEAMLRGR